MTFQFVRQCNGIHILLINSTLTIISLLILLLQYLVFVGGIFVTVAVILYITIIVLAIASRKCKCLSTEIIVKWHELHASKAHFWFIVTVVAVSFLATYVHYFNYYKFIFAGKKRK